MDINNCQKAILSMCIAYVLMLLSTTDSFAQTSSDKQVPQSTQTLQKDRQVTIKKATPCNVKMVKTWTKEELKAIYHKKLTDLKMNEVQKAKAKLALENLTK